MEASLARRKEIFLRLPFEEHLVKTSSGFVSVAIYGDQEKPVLITYPDLALNQLLQLGAAAMSYNDPLLSVDDLADLVAEVLDYFGRGADIYMGVTIGAYVLTLFAIKYNTTCAWTHHCFSFMQNSFMDRMVV
ncbi:unnamed protein product [Lactuca virosa]|uniref:Uncharacterized protein n=1 Tax=Lactuca virosa TaxID=75947 RepID=A0AAU9P3Q7_9ASTR|nr:unnamed protein product [Lactuca virosa]